MDIVNDPFPNSGYDVVCLFEAIEHLSREDWLSVLRKIKEATKVGCYFMCCTSNVERGQIGKGNIEHDNEFEDLGSLEAFVGSVFPYTGVFATFHPYHPTLYWVSRREH